MIEGSKYSNTEIIAMDCLLQLDSNPGQQQSMENNMFAIEQ